ncbi:ribosomal protein L6, alpha-beta domain-containing protein [Panaeolus papilionaceus]|nr:ribosomal protein L6, alpha-beta domain-containing protein [Panaeolus papilionaceus]
MIIRSPALQSIRSFSTTARVCKTISIIGREPIKIPPSVQITTTPTDVKISGPLGLTSLPLKSFVKLEISPQNTLSVSVETPKEKVQRQMWGTTRTLISNAIIGMTEGFSVPLYLVGVGYKAALEADPRGTSGGGSGQRLLLKLGHSHPIFVPIPPHIKVEVPSPTKIVLSCTDKHLLGLFAAKIREYRKPEPYKGKGVFVGTETIRIKSVKKK